MRVLIIDNYDSFTYNVWHLLARVTGHRPQVLRNDDRTGLTTVDLRRFDAVVVSPGPGRPARRRDLGISAWAVRQRQLPVLGICLGHQALCHAAGGRVAPAPAPVHGRRSLVHHDGRELFAGVPSPFPAVRYHSLAGYDLPDTLQTTAWTADGVLMGVRDRTARRWGMQFHPESVATRWGELLLANLRDLVCPVPVGAPAGTPTAHTAYSRAGAQTSTDAQSRATAHTASTGAGPPAVACRTPPAGALPDTCAGPPAPGAPSGPPRAPHARERRPRYRLHLHQLLVAPDAPAAFAALFGADPAAFWLDSAQVLAGRSRFSMLGSSGGPLAEVVTYRVAEGTVTVRPGDGGPAVRERGGLFDYLDRELAARRIPDAGLPCGFALGYVGYLGYELKAETGGRAAHTSPYPDAGLIFCDRALVLDHRDGRAWLLALDRPDGSAGARAWLGQAAKLLAALPPVASPGRVGTRESAGTHRNARTDEGGGAGGIGGVPGRIPEPVARHGPEPATAHPIPAPADRVPGLVARHPAARYARAIRACLARISAGESYEICLTTMLSAPLRVDPLPTYLRLRRLNPAPYAALLRLPGLAVLSSSPERFLRVGTDRTVESRPIKGTRPRDADPVRDAAHAAQLRASAKDRAENLMIVDLVRNDLGRVCEPGSVEVPQLFAVESFPSVHQLVSAVRGRLRPDVSAVDCVRAAFPGGSMTGAPKVRTMEIIDRLEGGPRGPYSGALGYFSLSGEVDLSIVIRTIVATGDEVAIGTGGAITAGSRVDAEIEEAWIKAGAPLLALAPP